MIPSGIVWALLKTCLQKWGVDCIESVSAPFLQANEFLR
jgi:hypothetical protein